MSIQPYRIEGVLFDFDGTLTRPGALDFSVIKRAIGCPEDIPVLEFLDTVGDERRRLDMTRQLNRFEMEGAAMSTPNAGAEQLIDDIKKSGLAVGILTRNSRASVNKALENFSLLRKADIDVLITREDPVKIKPSGEGVLLAAEKMGLAPERVLVVGDYRFDMQAGREAGALTAYLANQAPVPDDIDSHFTLRTLQDLRPILVDGMALPAGKLPNAFLDELLARYRVADPSVIVGPSVGEDTAAVDIGGHTVLILKSDPITFATASIGRYAVLINANDMATAGAEPRWMLATLLLPVGFSKSQVRRVFADLHEACSESGIALCGGHSEITDAVVRPVITGMMAGTIDKGELIRKDRMAPGDRVLITKGIAVEGTAIIATEFRDLLLGKGMSASEIETCMGFGSMLSVLPEARIAREIGGASALHDVTEGGVATALEELSQAGGRGLCIRRDALPVYPQTHRLAELLGIDPLGLIGSGSLLICCRPDRSRRMMTALASAGVAVADIGEVTQAESGVDAVENGSPTAWPRFEVDEIARLFAYPR